MPQLAPLNWALAPLIFWFILLLLTSTLWWSPNINFPINKATPSQFSFSPWNWK